MDNENIFKYTKEDFINKLKSIKEGDVSWKFRSLANNIIE